MSDFAKEVIDKNIIEGTRYFISLVELGSYTAVKNYYSVEINTLRNKIGNLESYLGVKLLQQNNNKIEITKDGKKYYASCHRLYTDLENSILSSKYKGIDKLNYIRIFGLRSFIDYILPNVYQINTQGKYTFTFDSYLLSQATSYFYQLSNYDIAIVASKDLEKIDQDRWVVCATIDSVNLPSRIYVTDKLMQKYDLINKPKNIFKMPFVLRRDHTILSLNANINGKDVCEPLEDIRYIVEDDNHKFDLIENSLAAGILLDNYDKIANSRLIKAVEGITTETFHARQTVIVSKYVKNRAKIISFLREQVDGFVKTVLGK